MRRRLRRIVGLLIIMNLKLFTWVTHRPRARVLVLSEQDEVLLIKAFVSHGRWTLPGGGLKRRETAVAAARRELQEETGITADEADFVHLATLSKPDFKIPFTAPLFRLQVPRSTLPEELVNPREIAAIDWFKRDDLPSPLSLIAAAALDLDDSPKQG